MKIILLWITSLSIVFCHDEGDMLTTLDFTDDEALESFDGHSLNGSFHGHGKLRYKNGDVYEGEFKEGKMDGFGITTYARNDSSGRHSYTGKFREGLPHGQGTLIWTNGDVYIGEFTEGNRSGNGTITYAGGDTYEGQWKDNIIEGLGKLTYADLTGIKNYSDSKGIYFNGSWFPVYGYAKKQYQIEDYFDYFTVRDFYVGEFKNGKPNGYGQIVYKEDVNYTLVDGFFHEQWREEGVKLKTFEGQVINGSKFSGVETWSNGGKRLILNGRIKYQGLLKNSSEIDARHFAFEGWQAYQWWKADRVLCCNTLCCDCCPDYYLGPTKNGLPHGNGTLFYKDGSRYEGDFEEGYRSGRGALQVASGMRLEGEWQADSFSSGNITYPKNDPLGREYFSGDVDYFFDGAFNGTMAFKTSRDSILDALDGERNWFVDCKSLVVSDLSHNFQKLLSEHKLICKASLAWVDGSMSSADFRGNGTLSYLNGDVFIGQVENGLRSGNGTAYFGNGSSYEGEWKNDTMDGFGNFTFGSENRFEERIFYVGEFKNNQAEGAGKTFYKGYLNETGQNDTARRLSFEGVLKNVRWRYGVRYGVERYSDGRLIVYHDGRKYSGKWLSVNESGHGHFKFDGFCCDSCNCLDSYTGQSKNDLAQGWGTLMFLDGTLYEGQFWGGFREGMGTLVAKNGTKFEGRWHNDELVHGTLTFPIDDEHGRDHFEGDFSSEIWGHFHPQRGTGALVYKDGSIFRPFGYYGNFDLAVKEGSGSFKWPNGDEFDGYFVNDKPEGEGKLRLKNGAIFFGNFVNGTRTGKGKIYLRDRSLIVGEWENDAIVGLANQTFARNDSMGRDFYIGHFDGLLKHGQGTFFWRSGAVYEGNFDRGLRSGKGTYTWPTLAMYEGQWLDGKSHGFGKLLFAEADARDFYIGFFSNDQFDGQGKLVWKNGTEEEGEWRYGSRI